MKATAIPGLLPHFAAALAIAILASAPASAQTHVLPAGMDNWPGRLAGRYHFEGVAHLLANGRCGTVGRFPACEPVTGTGDCIRIGTSQGVHCVLNVEWPAFTERFPSRNGTPGATPYLNPAMVLFGIDPGNDSLSYLLVDNKGLAEGGSGSRTGNVATFLTTCVNVHSSCRRRLRIEAKPDANLLYMWIDVELGQLRQRVSAITLTLRRVPVQQDSASPNPGARN